MIKSHASESYLVLEGDFIGRNPAVPASFLTYEIKRFTTRKAWNYALFNHCEWSVIPESIFGSLGGFWRGLHAFTIEYFEVSIKTPPSSGKSDINCSRKRAKALVKPRYFIILLPWGQPLGAEMTL